MLGKLSRASLLDALPCLYEAVTKLQVRIQQMRLVLSALHLSLCYVVSVHERAVNIKTDTQLLHPVAAAE